MSTKEQVLTEALDELTRRNTAFDSFDALLTAPNGYRPSIDVRSASLLALANEYDEAQAARGDERRASRLFDRRAKQPDATAETMNFLARWMPRSEHAAVSMNVRRGEEREYFRDLVAKQKQALEAMPKMRETESVEDPTVGLHYFKGGCDWHITEAWEEDGEIMSFGLANLGYGGELGYISITELVRNGVELDLHFHPVPLSAVRAKEGAVS